MRSSWRRRLTAGAAGLVLVAGAVVVLKGQPAEVAVAAALPAPSVVAPSPSASPSPSPSPAPVPSPEKFRSEAQPDFDVASVLGPPPGPQEDRRPERVAAPEDRYAFLVGITDYSRPTVDTIGGAADVRFIARRLELAGWPSENIRVLTDRQASGRAVRDGMAWLADKGAPGTFTFFHFSGHVKQKGGGREALWPADRDFIDDREVTSVLSTVQGRLWVDIAGCEAASFLPGLPNDRVLFTGSSKGTEKSYEYPDWGMSVWTGLLFDQGLRLGKADADGNKRATMGEALRYSQYYSQVITYGQQPYGQQTPQYAGADDLGWTLADPPA